MHFKILTLTFSPHSSRQLSSLVHFKLHFSTTLASIATSDLKQLKHCSSSSNFLLRAAVILLPFTVFAHFVTLLLLPTFSFYPPSKLLYQLSLPFLWISHQYRIICRQQPIHVFTLCHQHSPDSYLYLNTIHINIKQQRGNYTHLPQTYLNSKPL